MEALALGHDLRGKGLAFAEAPGDLSRLANQQIGGEWGGDFEGDPGRLIQLVAARPDDQEVCVAVGVRRSVGMGTEEDDLVGLKPAHHLLGEPANG
jgi:hypothetical protein